MEQFIKQVAELFYNDTFWAVLTSGLLYLSGSWLRPRVEKIPKTNVFFRAVRLLHLVLDKVDPEEK